MYSVEEKIQIMYLDYVNERIRNVFHVFLVIYHDRQNPPIVTIFTYLKLISMDWLKINTTKKLEYMF